LRIGIVAPSCPLLPDVAARVQELATATFGDAAPELVIHPQCYLSEGHFAGSDAARADAFVEMANDPAIDALWFARGGYGACRMAESALKRLNGVARTKAYLGYSDAGFLLGGLYARGIGCVAHAPMPSDILRDGGDAAVIRSLEWLMGNTLLSRDDNDDPHLNLSPPLYRAGRRQVAFNLTVLSAMIGTPLMPDLTDHILMIEEVSEYMYRIDRSLFHLTNNAGIRAVAGIKLGRCTQIPQNDVDFDMDEEAVVKQWCTASGIAYLGRADIGHDVDNKVVAFG
jgi:muramoyltetrapeptide carboxypeptidase